MSNFIAKMQSLIRENKTLFDENTRLKAELEKHRWIPVEERTPEIKPMQSEWVLATDGKKADLVYYYDYTGRRSEPGYATGKGWYILNQLGKVTHWKPITLPEE
jgi:hypothetical protein